MRMPLALSAAMAAAILALQGCASTPPPALNQAVSQAEYAVNEAQQVVDNAGQSLPLYKARKKLRQAKSIRSDKGDYETAIRLAEQATLDARLAQAQAQAATARSRTQELREDLEALRKDLKQQGGSQ
ncbi:MAG: DUF4398 domain-containing protein [Ectothiorhodospiraceae bacterium]